MKLVILAGGGGSRLRPLSQGNTPKQFIALDGNKTMLEKTIERLLPLVQNPSDIIISTSEQMEVQIKKYVTPYGITHIVSEPARRNTAPAFALVLRYLKDIATKDNEPVIFFPSDHEILPEDLFRQYIHLASEQAQHGVMILFGIKPTSPETGYGYIKLKDNFFGSMTAEVEQFVEKPNLEKAIQYMQSGQYFWNAGIFAGTLGCYWSAFESLCPQLMATMKKDYDTMKLGYANLDDISIDYAIMEKLSDIKLIPMFLNWSDLGSRDAVYEFFPKDTSGNVMYGDWNLLDVENSLLYNTSSQPVKVAHIDNSIVVITDQGQYITKRGTSQDIKKLI